MPSLNAQVDWDTGKVCLTGKVPAPRGRSAASLREAALKQARQSLRTFLERVSKGGSGAYAIPGKDQSARLAALVASARVESSGPAPDGRYQVTLALTLPKQEEAGEPASAEVRVPVYSEPEPSAVHPYPAPPTTGEEALLTPKDAKGPFTGLVVDARGLPVGSGMSPRILDAALREVYSGAHLAPDLVEDIGVAGYAASLAAGRKVPRVGANPLVVRAIGASGAATPVIALEDARRFLGDAGVIGIVRKGAVCIVIGEVPAAASGESSTPPAGETHP